MVAASAVADTGIGRGFEGQMVKVPGCRAKEYCSYPFDRLFGESAETAAEVAAAAAEREIEVES